MLPPEETELDTTGTGILKDFMLAWERAKIAKNCKNAITK